MAAKKASDGAITVEVPPIQVEHISVQIEGLPPGFLSHRFGEDQKRQIRDKQQKRAPKSAGRAAKNPAVEYHGSLYYLGEEPAVGEEAAGRFGFPAIAFKLAMVSACRGIEGLSMTEARQMFFVVGAEENPDLVEIHGIPQVLESVTKVPPRTGAADLRYRAHFPTWEATLNLEFMRNVLSPEQILNLVNLAGFSVGIGDWRPEKGGSHGRYAIVGE